MPIDSTDFRNRKQQMLNLLSALKDYANGRSKQVIAKDLEGQVEHLQAGELNVVVCGECKKGKSSLINAFLEVDGICPVDAPVATNAITRIGYGEQERIIVRVHQNGKPVQAKEISRSEISEYVTEEKRNSRDGNRVELEVKLPSPNLRDGLVLYDTPGVGSLNAVHTTTTNTVLPFADAVLFVGIANETLAEGELNFIKDISHYRPHILHVLTKKDVATDPDSVLSSNIHMIEESLGIVKGRLKGVIVSNVHKLHYLDDKDPDILELSGFPEFETAIWELLKRGGDLLLGRAQGCGLQALAFLLPVVEAERAALAATSKADLEKLAAQYRQQEQKGNEFLSDSQQWTATLQLRRQKISTSMSLRLGETFSQIQTALSAYLDQEAFLNSPSKLADQLATACSSRFTTIVQELDEELGRLLNDLRKETSLNPRRQDISATGTPFEFTLKAPMIVQQKSIASKVTEVVTSGMRSASAWGFLGTLALTVVSAVALVPAVILGGAVFGAHEAMKNQHERDLGELRRRLHEEAMKQLSLAQSKAQGGIQNLISESMHTIEASLREEIRRAIDSSREALRALATKRSDDEAVARRQLQEKDSELQRLLSWRKSLEALVPPSEESLYETRSQKA